MLRVLSGLRCSNEAQTSMLLTHFRIGGRGKIMVVADFDYTLTRRQDDNGGKGCLTHEVFQTVNEKHTGCAVETLQRSINKHYETVLSRCNSLDESISVQVEWWNASHDIIIRSKVHRDQLSSIVQNSKLIWRKNTCQFVKLLEEMSFPLLIYSAGITDIIEEAIRQLLGHFPNNITVAANRMYFDERGYVVGFTNPPVCSLNKTMSRLRGELIPRLDDIYILRTNVLLIGDNETDASMLDGWEKKKLKIGLLEEKMPDLHAFDIVITGCDCTRLIEIVKFITS